MIVKYVDHFRAWYISEDGGLSWYKIAKAHKNT